MEKYPIEVTERRVVKRITVGQSITDFLDAFNVERGLIYTVKLLYTRPGELIRYYLTDGRFRIVNAFRLLIITTAASLILLGFTNSFEEVYNVTGNTEEQTAELTAFIESLFTDWYNLILWLSIPCYALASFLFLRKYESFNYAEHLVIQSFLVSLSNILIILCLPIGYFTELKIAFMLSITIGVFYYLFVFWDIFKKKTLGFFLRILLAYVIGNAFYLVLMGLGLAAIIYLKIP